jgi:hypothetical protein
LSPGGKIGVATPIPRDPWSSKGSNPRVSRQQSKSIVRPADVQSSVHLIHISGYSGRSAKSIQNDGGTIVRIVAGDSATRVVKVRFRTVSFCFVKANSFALTGLARLVFAIVWPDAGRRAEIHGPPKPARTPKGA